MDALSGYVAAGVPIVAARAGGIPEAVRDDVNGLLVPPDDAAALVDAILRLAVSDGLRARLGDGIDGARGGLQVACLLWVTGR